MHKLTQVLWPKGILCALVVALAAACGSDTTAPTVTPPPPPPIPACQANHTAFASFRNNGSLVVDVLLDGGVLGSLAVGQTGLGLTIAAGVAHDIKFRVTNTQRYPCASFNPIPVECSNPVYTTCSF